jgi:hypothetical protein
MRDSLEASADRDAATESLTWRREREDHAPASGGVMADRAAAEAVLDEISSQASHAANEIRRICEEISEQTARREVVRMVSKEILTEIVRDEVTRQLGERIKDDLKTHGVGDTELRSCLEEFVAAWQDWDGDDEGLGRVAERAIVLLSA